MGAITNRMRSALVSIPDATETTVVGAGMEGVLNGADRAVFAANLSALAHNVTARVYLRATRGGVFVQNGASYTLAFGAPRRLDLSGLAGHEVKVTLEHVEGAATTIACEWQAQRGA